MNCNSLMNKVNYGFNFLEEYDIKVLSIRETWLVDSIHSPFVELEDFLFYRTDVVGNVRKHGNALYVCKFLRSIRVDMGVPYVVVCI